MMFKNLDYIALLDIHGVGYHCIINEISKKEPINLSEKGNSSHKSWSVWNISFYYPI